MSRSAAIALVALLLSACERSAPELSADASPSYVRHDILEALREDAATTRHPADGGGQAVVEQLEPTSDAVAAGTPGRWRITYTAGELGVAEGGSVFLQVSPFWGWSTPQVLYPEAPGYTLVTSAAEGISLEPETLDRQLLEVRVGGRALAAGEQIEIDFGAGPAGAIADRYAERRSFFWIAVDGDGDGVRKTLVDSPSVEVGPREAAHLVVKVPTTARAGDEVRYTVALLDAMGNAGIELPPTAPLRVELPEGLRETSPPERTTSLGARAGTVVVEGEGIYRIRVYAEDGLVGVSNPLVAAVGPRVLWADLHGHSDLSDGTGTPKDYFRYARDVARLDVVALTDHDHWGMLALAAYPHLWEEIRRETELFHQPERFVTLLGFEWTNWVYGHRHVLYFEDRGEIYDSLDPDYEHPEQLWAALRGQPALTFAHHSAGGPIPTDWSAPPDPELEPVTEITSVHGSSEAADSPHPIYDPVPGNFVRDVLDRGFRFGLIGSGDSHDGHPGLADIVTPTAGLAAIISEELTREGIFQALKSRRVYATSGPRILLRATLEGHPMGAALPAPDGPVELRGYLVGEQPITQLDVIRSGAVEAVAIEPDLTLAFAHRLESLRAGEYVYVRAIQSDGGTAWSSPFYVE